jgi:predicted RNase H-like HicB family nuclease
MGGYQLTAIIEREGDLFIAHCLEFDIASRGSSRVTALANLKETVASFVANAKDAELLRRLTRDVEVTLFEIECDEVPAWPR